MIQNDADRELAVLGGRLEWRSPVGIGVSFEDQTITDQDLGDVRALWPQVVWLDLSRTPVTNAACVHLRSARKLEVLRIAGTAIDASGLKLLRHLPRLVEVDIGNETPTARDLALLAELGWRLSRSDNPHATSGIWRIPSPYFARRESSCP